MSTTDKLSMLLRTTLVPPHDLLTHFVYGQVINFAGELLGSREWGFIAAVIFSILKEEFDRYMNRRAVKAGLPPPHGVSYWDAASTWLGAATYYLSRSV